MSDNDTGNAVVKAMGRVKGVLDGKITGIQKIIVDDLDGPLVWKSIPMLIEISETAEECDMILELMNYFKGEEAESFKKKLSEKKDEFAKVQA